MIAASAIASLPFINTLSAIFHSSFLSALLLFYLDDHVRAHGSAECASEAGCLICDLCRVVTFFVYLIGRKSEDLLRANVDAKSASLAVVCVKCLLSHCFLLFIKYGIDRIIL